MKANRRDFLGAAAAFALAGCTGAKSVMAGGPAKLRKLGTLDVLIVEANPIVFKGKLWLMEYIRWRNPNKRYPKNHTGDSYFRFRDMDTMMTFTPAFGRGLHMGNAFVDGDKVIVTAVENWGKSRFYQMESTDLVNWTEPRVILEGPGWAGYNTSVCKADDRYIMVYELGKIGVSFTMFFAESKDLKTWTPIEGAEYGRNFYTGAPMVRYHDGWYYFFYLEKYFQNKERMFRTRVVRSRDLKNWTLSPHIVLTYDEDDRLLHPKNNFTEAERKLIRESKNINASDLDMCDYNGKLVCCYSWGNQLGTEYFALAEADVSEKEFCESFFR
ncbi:MAG: hypothetical protein J6R18_07530 [Kiritimatiellae bacterium]|nr:hypothetical protein [Kiritimatiellia bacterium]